MIAIGTYKGYRSGWIAIITQVLSLLTAYLITFFFVGAFADFLSSVIPLRGLLATMVGGIVLFILTSTLVGFTVSKLLKLVSSQNNLPMNSRQSHPQQLNARPSSNPKSNIVNTNDAIIGAALGGILGALSGVFIGWVYSSASQLFLTPKDEPAQVTRFQQTSNKIVNKFIQVAASNIGDDNGLTEGTSILLSNPGENIKRIKRIQNSGVLRNFFQSASVAQALSTKNAKLVMQTNEFQQLVSNSDFIALTQQIASLSETKDFRKATAIKITSLWNQVEQVKQNSEFQDLLYSAEVQSMSRSYNAFAMLNSDKIARLLELIANSPVPDIRFEDLTAEDERQKTVLFRWVDENGKVHYSDKDNENKN